ncbi:MAG: CalY family protein [Erysipelotrichaceae bacterium]|nr:CalY family protein [Erysipelotrichaceae bacterium]
MNNTADKKDIFYIIVLILTFITVIIGATFALYSLIFSQKEGSSAVYTGTLSIEYLSGNIINCNLLYPSEKPSFETEKNIYKNKFKVTNTGSLDILLEITIEINKNEFSNQTLKYSLYNQNQEEISEGYIEGKTTSTIASNIYVENKTSEEFVLMIWIEENGQNQNTEMRKNLTGLIRVDASQKID